MGLLQKVISRLDSPDKLVAILDDIGKAHYHYGAVPEYVDVSKENLFDLNERDFKCPQGKYSKSNSFNENEIKVVIKCRYFVLWTK